MNLEKIPILLVDNHENYQQACREIQEANEIAIDTEFVGEDRYRPDLCLLQIATANNIFLIDPIKIKEVNTFWNCLQNPNRVVVGHALREEIRMCTDSTETIPMHFIDLQIAAGFVGISYPVSYSQLVYHLFRKKLDKSETLTNWRKRPLTREQIEYAADDVRFLLSSWKLLKKQLTELNRIEWLKEETDQSIRLAVLEPSQLEKWRKLAGTQSFEPKRLGILKAIYEWREEKAINSNRPMRQILRDQLVVEIARKNPKQLRDLSSLRGLSRDILDELWLIIQAVMGKNPQVWPKQQTRNEYPHYIHILADLVQIQLNSLSHDLKIASNLICSISELRNFIYTYAEGLPIRQESIWNTQWRSTHILPKILPFLRGEVALRIADLKSNSPLSFFPTGNLEAEKGPEKDSNDTP